MLRTYDSDLDKVPSEDSASAIFSLLFNIWSNAIKGNALLLTKSRKERIDVALELGHDENNKLYISIKNPCDIPNCHKKINNLLTDQPLADKKGLAIIRQKLRLLGWSLSPKSEATSDYVHLIIVAK